MSVGIGIHDRGEPASKVDYELLHRTSQSVDNEAEVITGAISWLNNADADGLVTYNGVDFDLPFLRDRIKLNDTQMPLVFLDEADTHVDPFKLRKQRCERTNEGWPSLEGCLEAYGLPLPSTIWNGGELTNVRFGEEIGPAYLDALSNGGVDELTPVVEHYLRTDLEANFTVYYSDIGEKFEPSLLDSEEEF